MWTQETHADDKPVMLAGRERWPVATLTTDGDPSGTIRLQIVPFEGAWVPVVIGDEENPYILHDRYVVAEVQASINWAYKFMENIGGTPDEDAMMQVEQLIGDNA